MSRRDQLTDAERAWLDRVRAARPPLTAQQLDLIKRVLARAETPDANPASAAA